MTKTMTESLSIPSFTFSDEINATNLLKLRQELKAAGQKVTVLPFFIKALSLAMLEFPEINSHIDNEVDSEGYIQRYVIKKDHNFSIAIDSPDGLLVPAMKRVQDKSIIEISNELKSMQEKAVSGGFTHADYMDATFSVSSVGNIGGKYFVPTILRPQAAIIALGKAYKTAKFVEDNSKPEGFRWEPQDSINFSISADHRILDGATVARFSMRMKDMIESPNSMLLSMR